MRYFTVTVFSTVGFGDITASSQSARLVVTVQMLLDLLALGLVVRAFVGAVQLARQRAAPAADPGVPPGQARQQGATRNDVGPAQQRVPGRRAARGRVSAALPDLPQPLADIESARGCRLPRRSYQP